MSQIKYASLLYCVIIACTGCTTISSTMLNRTDGDSFYKNSKTCGVPIRLEVDSHLDVYIEEQFLLRKIKTSDTDFQLQEARIPGRHLSVRTDVVKSHQLFTVDFKRPASGLLEYGSTFNEYYFAEINNKLDDNTIEQSAALVAKVGSLLGIGTTETESDDGNSGDQEELEGKKSLFPKDPDDSLQPLVGSNLDDDYFPQRRVVAYKRFDINSPCFEREVMEFINLHINSCNQCSQNDQGYSTQTVSDAPAHPATYFPAAPNHFPNMVQPRWQQ